MSAAGAVDHSQLVQLAEKAFSGLPSSGPSSQELVTKARHLTPGRTYSHYWALPMPARTGFPMGILAWLLFCCASVPVLSRHGKRQMSVQHPAYFTGSDVRVRDPDLPKLHFAVAFKGASWTDPDAIPLMVIQSIIGAWNNRGQGGALCLLTLSPEPCKSLNYITFADVLPAECK